MQCLRAVMGAGRLDWTGTLAVAPDGRSRLQWGYGGLFPGAFCGYDEDRSKNAALFAHENGFRSAHLSLRALRAQPELRDWLGAFVESTGMRFTFGPELDFFAEDLHGLRRALDRFLDDLQELIPVLRPPIVHACVGPYHRFMDAPSLEEQMDRLALALQPLARFCRELGCPFGLENHGDYYLSDLVGLCERTPDLGIFLDTGNTYLIGEQSVAACVAAAPYVIGTHFKDHRVCPNPRELKFVIEGASLGSGHVGLEEIFAALMKASPDPENLCLQWELVPGAGEDPWESLRRSWEFCLALEQSYFGEPSA